MQADILEQEIYDISSKLLEALLCDHATGKNIVWADGEYVLLGEGFSASDEITLGKITGKNAHVIKPRFAKAALAQTLA